MFYFELFLSQTTAVSEEKKTQSIRVILADIKRRKITKRKHYHGGSKRIFTCMGNR